MKKRNTFFIHTLIFTLLLSSWDGFSQTSSFITVEGEVLKPLKLTVDNLLKYTQTEIVAKGKDDKEHKYTGVRLIDVLDSAGVTLGSKLRGENLAKYVLVKAIDGYKVTFTLAEIDPEFTDQTILLAYKEDGNPLKKGEGPFRMIVPKDKKHARWIREMSTIKILFSKE
ncbi:MAG TPA: molybdopterin-dependent oxidoreductase [Cyclobacteriaceae bacterium]|jgi:DMSO/TMAO reductase YedYZ molybdopterin-dependent catalytic subunit|nr:molybdopterin-dependent oxidoreductase [Cyclobacteriaceae bacterium]